MARMTSATVDKIKQAADIVEVVSDYVNLQPSGSGFKGLCPFHSEKTPSFNVSKDKNIFKCFGCGEGGDAVHFLAKIKNITYAEALQNLADRYHVPVEMEGEVIKKNDFSRYYEVMFKAASIYSLTLTNLDSGKEALKYATARGLDIATIQTFGLGYAAAEVQGLLLQMQPEFEPIEMMEVGLVKKNEKGYIDLFRNRLMFPIHNEQNRVIGFSGRELSSSSEMKYINSPQSRIFTKGNVLYNLNRALPFIQREKRVFLFEGFFDVISAYQAGIKEGVCSMGTALTEEQALLLKKYTNHAIICYDGDKAGFEATSKAIKLLEAAALQVAVVLLPEKLDPDEYTKKYSGPAFLKYVNENQIDPFEFEYQYVKNQIDFSKPSQVEQFKLRVFQMLKKKNSQMLLEIYMKKMSEDINVSYESIESDMHHLQITKAIEKRKEQSRGTEQNRTVINKCIWCERRLVTYFIENAEYRKRITDEITSFFAKDKFNMKFLFIAEEVIKTYDQEHVKEKILEQLPKEDRPQALERFYYSTDEFSTVELSQLLDSYNICQYERQELNLKQKLLDNQKQREELSLENTPEAMEKFEQLKKESIEISGQLLQIKTYIKDLRKQGDKLWKKAK